MALYVYNWPDPGGDGPDLEQLHLDIDSSAMADKDITDCRWDEEAIEPDEELNVTFDNTLSAGDKTILDGLIPAVP